MMADQEHLEDGAQQEEDEEDDRHGEDGLLQATQTSQVGIVLRPRSGRDETPTGVTTANRRRDKSIAAAAAGSRQDGDGDKGTEEDQIQDQGGNAKGRRATDEARREQGQEGPEHSGGGNDFDHDDPCGREQIMFVLHGEEVRKSAEDQQRRQKLEQPQKRLVRLEESAAERHDDGD